MADNKNKICPVCRSEIADHPLATCDHCGWECTPVHDSDFDYVGGPNEMSVNQAREAYKKGEPVR